MIAHLKRKLNRTDKKGGIEGLPMELMIIIVVAALGTAMLVGWMSNIEEPETIGEIDSSTSQFVLGNNDTKNFSTTITVRDGDGDPIKGATVVLTGCGVKNASSTSSSYYYSYLKSNTSSSSGSVNGTTDDNGQVTFKNISVTKTSAGVGYVNVQVSAGDYGEDSIKIPVVR